MLVATPPCEGGTAFWAPAAPAAGLDGDGPGTGDGLECVHAAAIAIAPAPIVRAARMSVDARGMDEVDDGECLRHRTLSQGILVGPTLSPKHFPHDLQDEDDGGQAEAD